MSAAMPHRMFCKEGANYTYDLSLKFFETSGQFETSVSKENKSLRKGNSLLTFRSDLVLFLQIEISKSTLEEEIISVSSLKSPGLKEP